MEETKGYRFFVLGAGFSKPAGLPLGSDLWQKIHKRASQRSGSQGHFQEDLDTYLRFISECDGFDQTEDEIDFEQFMAFLDIEYFLGLRGSDTFSDDGNETQIIIKKLIGEIISEATPKKDSLPNIYYNFAKGLGRGDYILTFNYDTLLERALEHEGIPFRLFPSRFEEIFESHGVIDTSRSEVTILKLHGSVDWFDRASYDETVKAWKEQGATTIPYHLVFGPDSDYTVTPLLEGPQFPSDPLLTMNRVIETEALYKEIYESRAVPWLLSPSHSKIVYADKLRDFWWGLGKSGGMNLGLIVIGYSLPKQDDYARQALYRLTKNYQNYEWDEILPGISKPPMILIDRKENKKEIEAYRRRYSFVDPSKSRFHFSGFDEKAIELINT